MQVHTLRKRLVTAVFKDAEGRQVPPPGTVDFEIVNPAVASISNADPGSVWVTGLVEDNTSLNYSSGALFGTEPVEVVNLPLGPAVTVELVIGDEVPA
jgi:hypothetical protein